jgi:transposase
MNEGWLVDGRKIPDEVRGYIRKIAVQAIPENGQSPEVVGKVLNFNRSCIYEWLKRYDEGGYEALGSRRPPGAKPLITREMEGWLEETVLNSTPVQHGYDTNLWTRDILAELLKKEFGVSVSGLSVSLHLRKGGLSYQKPCYRALARDEREVEHFVNDTFPRIHRLADKMGADIGFEDEAGIGLMRRSGRTWGRVGSTPVVPVVMPRGGYNVLSIVTPKGEMNYSVMEESENSERYIEFLDDLIHGRERPLILIVDQASFHGSQKLRAWVRAHRTRLRIFSLPKCSPELNPDEQVWNEVKNNKLGKQPIKNKRDLKQRLYSALRSLQRQSERIRSFFQLPDTLYASMNVC